MNKTKLISLLLKLQKQANIGISLTELLVALVMGGIVLTGAASGFVNLLRANQDVESKTVTNAGLARALAFIQEDIKKGISVEAITAVSTTTTTNKCDSAQVDSAQCLKITLPDDSTIYYGFKDISNTNTSSVFLKPGILKRQEYDSSADYIAETDQTSAWEDLYTTVADALINSSYTAQPITTCNQDNITFPGTSTLANNDIGFRFCTDTATDTKKRLVRIFLYGYVGKNQTPLSANIITFARSGS